MKYIPQLIMAGVIIVLLLFTCNKKPSKPIRILSHTSDTIVLHDTIIDTLEVHHTQMLPSKTDTLILSDSNTFKHKYYYPIKDSLLEGSIIALSNDRPQIDFSYKLKNYHTSTHTTIKDTIVLSNRGFLYGGDVVVSPLFSQISAGLSYQFDRGDVIDVSVGRDFNNKHNIIRVGYRRKF